jgi:hypothetical protein
MYSASIPTSIAPNRYLLMRHVIFNERCVMLQATYTYKTLINISKFAIQREGVGLGEFKQ